MCKISIRKLNCICFEYNFQVLLKAAKLESELAALDVGLEEVERTPEVIKPNVTVHKG